MEHLVRARCLYCIPYNHWIRNIMEILQGPIQEKTQRTVKLEALIEIKIWCTFRCISIDHDAEIYFTSCSTMQEFRRAVLHAVVKPSNERQLSDIWRERQVSVNISIHKRSHDRNLLHMNVCAYWCCRTLVLLIGRLRKLMRPHCPHVVFHRCVHTPAAAMFFSGSHNHGVLWELAIFTHNQ